ncbi:hypothetical protein RB195_014477 [Necator americanus]
MRFNDNRWTTAVSDWIPPSSNAPQEDRRSDGQTSSRSPSKKSMTLFEFLARRDATGQHLRAIGTNGSITGACSSKSMNNGSTGDTGD